MRVFNAETGESVQILKEHSTAVLALAANDDLVFSGSFDNTIKVWGQQITRDADEDE
jgi:WD40 repeat protein